MQWHLIGPDMGIVRSVTATCLAHARFRLAPIPERHFVASAADYANGYHQHVTPPVPMRLGRGDWYAACDTDEDAERVRAKLRHAATAGLLRWQAMHPEKEQARRAKIAAYQRARAAARSKDRAKQANIQRGIARRNAKREGRSDAA